MLLYLHLTMADALDHIFNGYALIAINVLIVVLALTVGNGIYFLETGLIHLIALVFIGLAVLRIFFRHDTYDPVLEKFVRASLFALLIFAGSHIVEYVSMMVLTSYQDTVFANVANFYLIGIFSLIAGATYFSGFTHKTYAFYLRQSAYVCIGVLFLFSLYLSLYDSAISLEPDGAPPYLYAALILAAGTLAAIEIYKIRRLTHIMRGFTAYLLGALLLILAAILPNIFYDAFPAVGFPGVTSIYVSHFIFYAALSLLFLSFKKVSHLGGLYEDVQRVGMRL